MNPDDFRALAPHLEPVSLPKGLVLAEANEPIEWLYFLDSGICSIVAASPAGLEAEAGLIGRDGFAPVDVALSSECTPHRIVVHVAGTGWRTKPVPFAHIFGSSASLRQFVLRFVHLLSMQVAATALSNAVHPVDLRLARWLLMCHDRSASDEIPLTHDLIASVLAVRRPSITTALHVLEGSGFIRSDRGYVTILDRHALEAYAADSYGHPEAEYRRLFGPLV